MAGWPTPPAGWRWWRLRRGFAISIAFATLGAALSALFLLGLAVGVQDHRHDHAAYLARRDHGVRTTATILSSHYDANGGDPGGWTTQVVLIPTPSGPVRAVVGHHDKGDAGVHTVAVIYDPANPANAQTVQDFAEFGDYSVTGSTASMTIAIVFYGLAGLTLLAALSIPVRYFRARRQQRHLLQFAA